MIRFNHRPPPLFRISKTKTKILDKSQPAHANPEMTQLRTCTKEKQAPAEAAASYIGGISF